MSLTAADGLFWLFGLGAVVSGLRVFATDSMVRASFSLLVSFLCVGALLVMLLAEYLGVALWFMMALEMVVMALFMVAFMMNPAGLNPMRMVHHDVSAKITGAAGAVALLGVGLAADVPERPIGDVAGSIEALGHELLGGSMLIFESAGVALLATMIGAIVLSASSSRYGAAADAGSHPPPIDPDDPASVPDLDPSGSQHQHGHGGHG